MPWYKRMSTRWLPNLRAYAKRNPKLAWGSSLAVGGLLYLKVWLPATNVGIPCVFYEVTGHYCPGCGMTRAALALLQLDAYQAFRYNSLAFVLLPLFLAYHAAVRKRLRRTSHALMGVMLTLTVAFGVLRNVPAFDWLAPTIV